MFRLFKKKNNKENEIVINVFTEGMDKNSYARKSLEAMVYGINSVGDKCNLVDNLEYKECDIAVIFGDVRDAPAKKKRMRLKAEIIGRHRGKGLIVIDTPVLMRPFDKRKEFRRVGIDSLFADDGNFNNDQMLSNRWEKLSKKYNIKKNTIDNRGSNIYVLLQRFFDASLKGSQKFRPKKYFEWLESVLIELEKETDKKIIIRPHPGSLNDQVELNLIEEFKKNIKNERLVFDYQKKSLFEVLDDAFATITYNSGSAIDSLLYGVPNISYDSGSHVYSIVPHKCKNIDKLMMPNIEQWLFNVAHVDWNLDELRKGEAWLHLKNCVLKYI